MSLRDYWGRLVTSDGYELTLDKAESNAAARGLVVVHPTEHEIFVDLDNDAALERFESMLPKLREHVTVESVQVTPSASGLPHRHAVVMLKGTVTPMERLLLQAILGSDPVRELLGFARERAGIKTSSLFFEKPLHEKPRFR